MLDERRVLLARRRTRADHRHARPATPTPPDRRDVAAVAAGFLPPARSPTPTAADSLNAALRSLHEPSIIDAKRAAAQQLLETLPDHGGKLDLTEDAAHAWTASVNDVRLALGTMLDIQPDGPDRLPDDHPLAAHLDVYQWLTVLQEYLVVALMGSR